MMLKTIGTNPLARMLLIDRWRSIVFFFDNMEPGAQRQGVQGQKYFYKILHARIQGHYVADKDESYTYRQLKNPFKLFC